MRRLLPVLCLLLSCTSPVTDGPAPGTLSGRLVARDAAAVKAPLAGARVVLAGTSISATSAADGRFAFARVPASWLQLRVAEEGRALVRDVVMPEGSLDLGELLVEATGGIEGLVTAAGVPVPGAQVVVQGFSQGTTGADGTFAIDGLPTGAFEVVALHDAKGARATAVGVAPGARTHVSLQLEAGVGTMSGRAIATATGVTGVTVTLVGSDGRTAAQVVADADGDFALPDVPPGVYTVSAQHRSTGTATVGPVGAVPGATLPVVLMLFPTTDPPACAAPANCEAVVELPDAGAPDAGTPDAGEDAGTPDAGEDAGTPDAGEPETCSPACEAPTLICGSDLKCRECEVDADCDAAESCELPAGTCVPTPPACSVPCEASTPICRDDGMCVECEADAACAPTLICDVSTGTCVPPDCGAPCESPTPICGRDGQCHQCVEDTDCGSSRECRGGQCLPRGNHCATECTAPTPVCGADSQCHACGTDLDCGADETCDSNGDCVPNGPVCSPECFGAKPVCGADSQCHECGVDADCGAQGTCLLPAGICSAPWHALTDLPDRRTSFPFGWDAAGGRLLLGGGTGGSLSHDDLWAFTRLGPGAGSWKRIAAEGMEANFQTFQCTGCGFVDSGRGEFVVLAQTTSFGGGFGVWSAPLAGGSYSRLTIGNEGPVQPPASSVYDAKYKRGLAIGAKYDDAVGHVVMGVWSLSLPASGTPQWTLLAPTGTAPSARSRTAAAYDPVKQRLLLYGGKEATANLLHGDLWELTLPDPAGSTAPAWTQLSTSGGPGVRDSHMVTIDTLHDAFVVFGGDGVAGRPTETWAYDLSAGAAGWTQIATTGPHPGGRMGAGMVFDGQRILIAGGQIQGQGDMNDVWSLDLSGGLAAATWSPASPYVFDLTDRAIAWDAVAGRAVAFGGWTLGSSYTDDTVTFTLGEAREWTLAPTVGVRPAARFGAAATFDGARTIVFGGRTSAGDAADTWALPSVSGSASWVQLHDGTGAASPRGRQRPAIAYDDANRQLVVFGGVVNGQPTAETWVLDLSGTVAGAWTKLTATGPEARSRAQVAWDPAGKRLFVTGGRDRYDTPIADLWELSLAGGAAAATWTQVQPAGTAPVTPRALVWDAPRHRILVYDSGGTTLQPGSEDGTTDPYALFSLDLSSATPTWVQICPGPGQVAPPALDGVAPTGGLLAPTGEDFALYGWMGGPGAGVAPVWSASVHTAACP